MLVIGNACDTCLSPKDLAQLTLTQTSRLDVHVIFLISNLLLGLTVSKRAPIRHP